MTDNELIEGLRAAMLGTEDGDFIDQDSDIPAGEMFRLASEYMMAVFREHVEGSAKLPQNSEHTAPTDDERESAEQYADSLFIESPLAPENERLAEVAVDAFLAGAGFRRGAPAEPAATAPAICDHGCTAITGVCIVDHKPAERGAPAKPAAPTARVVPNDPITSACSSGYCPSGCSHMMWKCDTCQCEGGWGAPVGRLEDFAQEHVCPPGPAPAEPAVTVTERMVDIMQEAMYDDMREADRPVIRAALEAALNGGAE